MTDLDSALDQLEEVARGGVRVADEPTSKTLLRSVGIAIPEARVVGSPSEASEAAEHLGMPVAVKIVATDMAHKTEAVGVAGPLASRENVEEAAAGMIVNRSKGSLLVERWHGDGTLCFVGLSFDGEFGPVVSFGLGGIWVEVIRDVAHRLAPVTADEAVEMISGLQAAPVLRGDRGASGVDIDELTDTIARFSELAGSPRAVSLLSVIEVNPLSASQDGRAIALDCTAVLSERAPGDSPVDGPSRRRADPASGNTGSLDADVRCFLEPASIAIIGASSNPSKPGNVLLRNLIEGGFPGSIFGVNPKALEIDGVPCYSSIAEVPEPVDLAIIVLRRELVLDAVRHSAEAGVRGVAIIAAGFGEVGEWGKREQAKLADQIAETGISVVGPNTIGLVAMGGALRGSFVRFPNWQDGSIAIIAQTGVFAGSIAHAEMERSAQRLGIRATLSIGNRVGVSEIDLLGALAADEEVGVIGLYLESFADGRAFIERAANVNLQKPVVLLKPGRTSRGAKAAESHTGALATDDAVLTDVLGQHGIVRAQDEEEFVALLKVFSYGPLPRGDRVGIVTFSGAMGVLATDLAVDGSLEVVDYAKETIERLSALLPDWQPVQNPVDLWPAVDLGPRQALVGSLGAALADPGVDQVVGILLAVPNAHFDGFRDAFRELRAAYPDTPLHLVMLGGLREEWTQALDGFGIPVHPSVRVAVRAASAAAWYVNNRRRRAIVSTNELAAGVD